VFSQVAKQPESEKWKWERDMTQATTQVHGFSCSNAALQFKDGLRGTSTIVKRRMPWISKFDGLRN
jgi:hypothetical protein